MITSNSPLLVVTNNSVSPNIYPRPEAYGVGNVRWGSNMGCFEIWDGSNWQYYSNNVTINLDPEVQNTVTWAKQKIIKEQKLEYLMAQHPGLKELHERFEVMLALVQNNSE